MQSTSHTPDPDSTVVGQVCYIHESLATPILRIFLETAATEENETIKLKCQEELDRLCTNPAIGKLRPCFTLSTNLKGTKTICVRGTIGQTDPNNLCGIIKHFYVGIFPNLGFYGTPHLHITPEERNPRSAVIAFEMTCDKDLFPTKKPSGPESSYSTIPPPSTPRKNRISQLEKQSLAILRELCQAKYSAWQVKCKKEPGYAEDCLKEFLEERKAFLCGSAFGASTSTLNLGVTSDQAMEAAYQEGARTKFGPNLYAPGCEICMAWISKRGMLPMRQSSQASWHSARSLSR